MITYLKPKRLGNIFLREIEEADYLDFYSIGSRYAVRNRKRRGRNQHDYFRPHNAVVHRRARLRRGSAHDP